MHMVMRLYRACYYLHIRKMRLMAKLFWIINRVVFSCDIGVGASIGRDVGFFHNGLGVVIHPRTKIGSGCSIYQNVTIGGNGKTGVLNGVPEIGNNVFIGAGAVLIGPIKVGDGAIIGANAVVNFDVPAKAVVVGGGGKIVSKSL